MLQEAIAKAEGEDGTAEEERELEELKQLLPEIREKVEDAAESQRTASAASQAIQQALVSTRFRRNRIHVPSGSGLELLDPSLQGGASTSSAFRCENGGPSSSSSEPASQVTQHGRTFSLLLWYQHFKGPPHVFQVPVTSSDSPPSKMASDISHLVRKKVGIWATCLFCWQFVLLIMLFNPLYWCLSAMP